MKVLITGGKSALALKVLKAFEQHQVLLADYGEIPSFPSKNYQFIGLGNKNEDTTAHTLLSNCLDEGVDLILPLYAFEILALTKAKVLFKEFNIEILLPHADLDFYLNEGLTTKPKQWGVFLNGQAIFMSMPNEQLINFAQKQSLNGSFYFNEHNAVANLTLFTI